MELAELGSAGTVQSAVQSHIGSYGRMSSLMSIESAQSGRSTRSALTKRHRASMQSLSSVASSDLGSIGSGRRGRAIARPSKTSSRFDALLQQLKEAHEQEVAGLQGPAIRTREHKSAVGFTIEGKVLRTPRSSERGALDPTAILLPPTRISKTAAAPQPPPFAVVLPTAMPANPAMADLPSHGEPVVLKPTSELEASGDNALSVPFTGVSGDNTLCPSPSASLLPSGCPSMAANLPCGQSVLDCELEKLALPPELTGNPLVVAALRHDQESLIRLTEDRADLCYKLEQTWLKGSQPSMCRVPTQGSLASEKKKQIRQSNESTPVNDVLGGGFLSTLLVVAPNDPRKVSWDVLTAIMLLYDVIALPVLIGFRPERTALQTVMDVIIAVVWSVDIVATLTTGYYNKQGNHMVLSLDMIALHYLKTWFLLDIILVAYDWILIFIDVIGDDATGGSNSVQVGRTLRTLRLVRTVRLLRLLKVKRVFQTIHDHLPSETASIMFRIMKILACLVFANHIVACIWYFIGNAADPGRPSWVRDYEIDDQTLAYKYLISVHWSLSQFTPAGMEVAPASGSLPERIFVVLVILVAMVGFSSFVSILTASIAELRRISSDETHQFWMLRRFLRDWKVPRHISRRIQRYLEAAYVKARRRVQSKDVQLLKLLSDPLRDELMHVMLARDLMVHKFFEVCGWKTRIFSSALESNSMARGDTIFTAGQQGFKMYFIHGGQLIYINGNFDTDSPQSPRTSDRDHDVFEIVGQLDYVSEASLWTSWLHAGDLEAQTDCSLIVVKAAEFQKSIALNTPFWNSVRDYAAGFIREINRIAIFELTDLFYQNFSPSELVEEVGFSVAQPTASCSVDCASTGFEGVGDIISRRAPVLNWLLKRRKSSSRQVLNMSP